MKVNLLDHTKLSNAVIAGRTCYQSWHLGGDYLEPTDTITGVDAGYLQNLVNNLKHKSISRHVQYVFQVLGISTKTLLGATRHQAGVNFSVMSSRYCKLNKFGTTATKTGNLEVDMLVQKHIEELKDVKASAEDLAYAFPQAMQYDMVISFNIQSLQHFLAMRDSSKANFDIQLLANLLRDALPEEHKYLFDKETK